MVEGHWFIGSLALWHLNQYLKFSTKFLYKPQQNRKAAVKCQLFGYLNRNMLETAVGML
jgi:hypothetical protein